MKTKLSIILVAVFIMVILASSALAVDGFKVFMPLVYDASPNPTVELPTPAPTRLPDGLWMYIVRAGENEDGEFEIYAQVPGIDWELEGYKVDKTVYVYLWCDAPVCDVWSVPPEFPAECNWITGEYCEVEKFIYPETAKEGCSEVYPFNCK